MAETPLLDAITHPSALRDMPAHRLPALAAEIRAVVTETISRTGGHLASNLGAVELTIALHRVFDFDTDRLVFDVGHQCYAHKLLTGRKNIFGSLRTKDGMSGFPSPEEHGQDLFRVGHAGTSVSTATGLAAAARLAGEKRRVVAVVGDGSIGNGMSFEALNHAGASGEDVLVVLNDNDMAISPTVGAISGYLSRIRTEPTYQRVREEIGRIIRNIPFIGGGLDRVQEALVDAVKDVIEPSHVFTDLGFHYYGPLDGHDLELLEREIRDLDRLHGPRLLHVVTRKGNGFEAARVDPETFHSAAPFEVLPCGDVRAVGSKRRSYTTAFSDAAAARFEADERVVAITAAMPAGTGVKTLAERWPDRFIDVGISEEHAVTLAAGLARGGRRPVVCIYSTFLQRGYDQIFHDVCLQEDLGVVFAMDRAGLVGADGPTHHGVFDIAMLRSFPGMVVTAPASGAELDAMLEYALDLGRPVGIRYPRASVPDQPDDPSVHEMLREPPPVETGRSVTLREGADGTVLAVGDMVRHVLAAAEIASERGVELTVVNLRFVKPLDTERIRALAAGSPRLFTVEDHALAGGAGAAVAEFLADDGLSVPLTRIGVPDRFIEHGERAELFADLGLDAEGLADRFAPRT